MEKRFLFHFLSSLGLSLVKFRALNWSPRPCFFHTSFSGGLIFSGLWDRLDIGPSSLSDRIMYLDLCHDFCRRRNLNLAMTSRLALTNVMITARGLECTFVIYSGTVIFLRLIWTKQLLPRCLAPRMKNTGWRSEPNMYPVAESSHYQLNLTWFRPMSIKV